MARFLGDVGPVPSVYVPREIIQLSRFFWPRGPLEIVAEETLNLESFALQAFLFAYYLRVCVKGSQKQ